MTTEQRFDRPDGQDVLGARINRGHREVVVTRPSHFPGLHWLRRKPHPAAEPGTLLIRNATGLLFLLGAGLLGVSLAAQYAYLLRERHQHVPSLIEALALDVGMLIFSLLALGLARAGQSAKAERWLILACAAGSAVMNYAAADVNSPRSVLAYTMPPVFLAIVADRVISVVRRHFLGMRDASAWQAAGHATLSIFAVAGKVALYGLRLAVSPGSTLQGARAAILIAAPVPHLAPPAPVVVINPPQEPRLIGRDPYDDSFDLWLVDGETERRPHQGDEDRQDREAAAGTKTARFLALADERYGPLAGFPLANVYRVAADLAPEVGLHPGTARKALRGAVVAATDKAMGGVA